MNLYRAALGYTAPCRPVIEPLCRALATLAVECVPCLQDAASEADSTTLILVHEAAAAGWLSRATTERSRPVVIVLTEHWSLACMQHWCGQGAVGCESLHDPERLAERVWRTLNPPAVPSSATVATTHAGLLQAVLDAIPVPVFYKDAAHIYRGCNEAFSACLGFSRERIIGSGVYDIAPKALADVYHAADEKLLASRGTQRYEAQVRYADGSLREIEFNKAVYFDAAGAAAGQVGVMLDVTERNQLMRKLEQASCSDALTGTGNRRAFTEVSRREQARCERNGQALSLLILDVDHFKRINDAWGHQAGDEVLVRLVQCLVQQLRAGDQLFRVGGEEFYLLLPDADIEQALVLAERLRKALKAHYIAFNGQVIPVTVSIGVAQIQAQESLDHCLSRADHALYRAKNGGRDAVQRAHL